MAAWFPPPVEKRFAVLCEILRAQHFAWRQAVVERCPGVDPTAVADRMWEITGVDTCCRRRPWVEEA